MAKRLILATSTTVKKPPITPATPIQCDDALEGVCHTARGLQALIPRHSQVRLSCAGTDLIRGRIITIIIDATSRYLRCARVYRRSGIVTICIVRDTSWAGGMPLQ